MSKSRGRAPIGPQNKPVEKMTGDELVEDLEQSAEDVADLQRIIREDEEETKPEIKRSEQNRLLRALMHLDCITQEITSLANEGALVGLFRKTCAERQVMFNDTNAVLWSPLKSVREVLEVLRHKTA